MNGFGRNKVHRLARSSAQLQPRVSEPWSWSCASALLSSATCAGFLMDTEWRTPKAALSRRPGRRRSSATPLPGRPPHPIPFNPPDIRGGEGSTAPSASAGRAPLFSVSHPDQELSLGRTAAQTSTPRLALVTRPPPTVTLSHALAHRSALATGLRLSSPHPTLISIYANLFIIGADHSGP
ncbi:hypothetical protein PANT_26c00002 [Moesziomyces antarcticus T-34]|uniref:Uncharacterized protein n=1 Tax=Pseudozyma antarctica (strain T-34) TaxID=1151754 RepID=M9LT08_PSEA3|nr:hypothetical protein PANT_26c00002 [Moesziomyces antarcticus T-34]